MARRCYSEQPIRSPRVTLAGGEAHHLLHVLRAEPGMRVALFDGLGAEFDAEVATCGRSTVELTVLQRREVDRELPLPLTLGAPLPKGDRQRWIVEKAVELGVTRLVPLVTERSAASGEKHSLDKLVRCVIEASKQCGRNRLMEVASPHDWPAWLNLAESGSAPPPRKWVAHPTGRPLANGDLGHDRPALVAVGPEGGMTDAETAAAQAAGWELIGLGTRLLRIETAAIGLVAALSLASGSR